MLEFMYKLDMKIQEQDIKINNISDYIVSLKDKTVTAEEEIIKDIKSNKNNVTNKKLYAKVKDTKKPPNEEKWIEVKSKNKNKRNSDIIAEIKKNIIPKEIPVMLSRIQYHEIYNANT